MNIDCQLGTIATVEATRRLGDLEAPAELQPAQRVLTVIPCLNEEKYLTGIVNKLLADKHELPMRIVIVDGGSGDRTEEIGWALVSRYPYVLFLKNSKRLQSAAVNLAVAMYGDDAAFLLRIDGHADYPNDYCSGVIAEIVKTGAASVVVTMNAVGITGFQKLVAIAQNSLLGNGGAADRIVGKGGKWVDHGHHALMRMDAFRAVGGYDESFSCNEDAELDTRLRGSGGKIWLTDKVAVKYYPRAEPWSLFHQYIGYGYGRARNILKHGTLPKLRQLAPAAVLPGIFLALLASVWPIAVLPLGVWILFCNVYGIILGIRFANSSIIGAGLAAMIMHLGWSFGFWKAMLQTLVRIKSPAVNICARS
jgi:succinoglycan biosynthesis protein ExoA